MAGKGGGAWKVAYADFVTAMMAFFMVMWLVGQNAKVKEAVSEHFNDPRAGRGRKGQKAGEIPHLASPSDNVEDLEVKKPKLLVLHAGERTAVGTVVPFENDSVELSDGGKVRINDLVPRLKGLPHKIEVRGHCSGRPLPAGHVCQDTWELAYVRSVAVMRFLIETGIPADRIRLSQAGNHEALTLDHDAKKQTRNDRVEIYLLNELATELQGTHAQRQDKFHQSTKEGDTSHESQEPHKEHDAHAAPEKHDAHAADHAAEGHHAPNAVTKADH